MLLYSCPNPMLRRHYTVWWPVVSCQLGQVKGPPRHRPHRASALPIPLAMLLLFHDSGEGRRSEAAAASRLVLLVPATVPGATRRASNTADRSRRAPAPPPGTKHSKGTLCVRERAAFAFPHQKRHRALLSQITGCTRTTNEKIAISDFQSLSRLAKKLYFLKF
jgi:hypothetical protein